MLVVQVASHWQLAGRDGGRLTSSTHDMLAEGSVLLRRRRLHQASQLWLPRRGTSVLQGAPAGRHGELQRLPQHLQGALPKPAPDAVGLHSACHTCVFRGEHEHWGCQGLLSTLSGPSVHKQMQGTLKGTAWSCVLHVRYTSVSVWFPRTGTTSGTGPRQGSGDGRGPCGVGVLKGKLKGEPTQVWRALLLVHPVRLANRAVLLSTRV